MRKNFQNLDRRQARYYRHHKKM